jgi:D-alanyl-D-alanine carboxypeptidase
MWNVDGAIGFSETAQDTTLMFHHSVGYAAGDLISSPSQLTVFLEALFGGELLSPEALIEMTGNRVPGHFVGVPIVECGAGLFVMDFDGRRLWGHGGSIPGYVTAMGHDPDSGLSIALCTNTGRAATDSVLKPAGCGMCWESC